MNTPLPPVIVTIPREAVESRNPFPVVDVLESWIPELCERNRNRVQFQILGYDEDSRELYDIPEVREYYRELYNRHPGLFYWIDTRSYMLVFLGLMFYPPVRRDGNVPCSEMISWPTCGSGSMGSRFSARATTFR